MSRPENKYSKIIYLYLLIGAAVLVSFDQFVKYLAVIFLKDRPSVVLIPGVFELSYLENSGAAFGIFQNKQIFFTLITIAFLIIAVFFILKIPRTGYYVPLYLTVTVLISGAVGNFIDRLVNKYVVDLFYFSLINFPIFNVADIYVTLSVIALVVLILFKYKDRDFDFVKEIKEGEDD